MSSLMNKVKDALHSDKSTEQPEGTHGPHKSKVANAADPRVDSDRDHRAAPSSTGAYTEGRMGTSGAYASENRATGMGTSGMGNTGMGTTGTAGGMGATGLGGVGHSSGASYEPNTESRYESRDTGARSGGAFGSSTTHGTGLGGTGGAYSSGPAPNTAGPHQSDMMNKADPRIDSDRDGRATTHRTTGGTTLGGTGAYSSGPAPTTSGPHRSDMMNKADPRIDSDRDGRAATHGTGLGGTRGTYGSGPAPNTAGPHKSDMLNKMDPQVDSDLDGSKTMGRDKTFQQSTNYAGRDPTDAAQVPPSVMQKHIGPPTIEHDDHTHDRTRRHSVSHQEQHRGL